MNILIIQENSRHKENKMYRECFCIQRAFKQLNINADIWGLGHDNFKSTINWNNYDLIINLENYDTSGWIPDFSNYRAKKFLWIIDPHIRTMNPYNLEFSRNKYDLKLQAVKSFVDDKSVWFANSCDDEIIKPLNIKKEHKFGFCGGMNEKRIKFFEYNDLKHLLYIIRDVETLIKENPEKIKNITDSGYNLVKQKHTYFERAKYILDLMQEV